VVLGNVTNIVASRAYGVDFLQYGRWMTLPVLVGAAFFVLAFYLANQASLGRQARPNFLGREQAPQPFWSRMFSWYGHCVLALCMAALVVASFWDISVICVAAPCAALVLAWDLAADLLDRTGWVARMSWLLGQLPPSPLLLLVMVCLLMTCLADTLCDIPNVVFSTRAITHPLFRDSPRQTAASRTAALFAVVLGSRLGATVSLFGSLTGILWHSQLPKGLISPLCGATPTCLSGGAPA
jgi:Na+/H+ antiporter NhaD/arsenite permease-like protein